MESLESLSREELIRRLESVEARQGGAASSALKDQEQRLRAILETAVEGIITIDARGIVESFNKASERIFGYTAAEVIGRNVSMLMPSPYHEAHDGYIENYKQTSRAKIIGIGREVVGLRKDGSTFPMDLSVSEVQQAGERLFTGFVRDITARKQAEQQLADMALTLEEKNKELETIVYVASHDLRSPLVNIQGFSRELQQSCRQLLSGLDTASRKDQGNTTVQAGTDIQESLEFILAGTAKMDALLSGLLRFSRLGRTALNIEQLDMDQLIENVRVTMEYQITQAQAALHVENPLPTCRADSTQINQIFTNLIDNALKYRDPNRPCQITIRGKTADGRAIFEVADNGIGITRDHQTKVFEIFHRLNPGSVQGEGLGLTIAQRLLDRQDGKIWLESTPGTGSTFFVSLPQGQKR